MKKFVVTDVANFKAGMNITANVVVYTINSDFTDHHQNTYRNVLIGVRKDALEEFSGTNTEPDFYLGDEGVYPSWGYEGIPFIIPTERGGRFGINAGESKFRWVCGEFEMEDIEKQLVILKNRKTRALSVKEHNI